MTEQELHSLINKTVIHWYGYRGGPSTLTNLLVDQLRPHLVFDVEWVPGVPGKSIVVTSTSPLQWHYDTDCDPGDER